MSDRRQRPIPVTWQERERLEKAKYKYEEATGDKGDWGKFLLTAIAAGMAWLGIYAFAKALQRSSSSVNVQCPNCDSVFSVAF